MWRPCRSLQLRRALRSCGCRRRRTPHPRRLRLRCARCKRLSRRSLQFQLSNRHRVVGAAAGLIAPVVAHCSRYVWLPRRSLQSMRMSHCSLQSSLVAWPLLIACAAVAIACGRCSSHAAVVSLVLHLSRAPRAVWSPVDACERRSLQSEKAPVVPLSH